MFIVAEVCNQEALFFFSVFFFFNTFSFFLSFIHFRALACGDLSTGNMDGVESVR